MEAAAVRVESESERMSGAETLCISSADQLPRHTSSSASLTQVRPVISSSDSSVAVYACA